MRKDTNRSPISTGWTRFKAECSVLKTLIKESLPKKRLSKMILLIKCKARTHGLATCPASQD